MFWTKVSTNTTHNNLTLLRKLCVYICDELNHDGVDVLEFGRRQRFHDPAGILFPEGHTECSRDTLYLFETHL